MKESRLTMVLHVNEVHKSQTKVTPEWKPPKTHQEHFKKQ